jgi:hypothetical protein
MTIWVFLSILLTSNIGFGQEGDFDERFFGSVSV